MLVLFMLNIGAALFVSAKERPYFDELLKHFDGELKAYRAQKGKGWRRGSAGEHTATQHFTASMPFS